MRWMLLALCLLVTGGGPAGAAIQDLPNPRGLRHQVEFWKQIFGTYSVFQVVVHDTWRLDRVYSVLDFSEAAALGDPDIISAYIEERTNEEKERIRAMLGRLSRTDTATLTAEERRIRLLFRDEPDSAAFLAAAEPDRIRGQRGLRERFANGIQISRRYLPEMETIFRQQGLPIQLTRLPLVESCFNVRAYSKVGAAGIWQFMPGTGRNYLQVGEQIDERRDPIKSTAAAAQFLRENYDALGNWALAVTAYNHGRAGMARAVANVGSSDIVEIIKRYRGPGFKFASRNFYAEFLAAVEVERDHHTYFGELQMARPVSSDAVLVPDSASLPLLARAANSDPEELADLNPALTPDVVRGKLPVPKGYRLRVPPGRAKSFGPAYAALRPSRVAVTKGKTRTDRRAPTGRRVVHRVEPGQTLIGIAKRYQVPVASLQKENNLRRDSRLRAGQHLMIPEG